MKWPVELLHGVARRAVVPVIVPALVSLLVALGVDPTCAPRLVEGVLKPFGL